MEPLINIVLISGFFSPSLFNIAQLRRIEDAHLQLASTGNAV